MWKGDIQAGGAGKELGEAGHEGEGQVLLPPFLCRQVALLRIWQGCRPSLHALGFMAPAFCTHPSLFAVWLS